MGIIESHDRKVTTLTPRILKHAIYSRELFIICIIAPGVLLGLGRDKCVTRGRGGTLWPELLIMSFYHSVPSIKIW